MVISNYYKFNLGAIYTPNRGSNQQLMKGNDFTKIAIVIKEAYGSMVEAKMIPLVFRDIFKDYVMSAKEDFSPYSILHQTWNERPFRLWQVQLNFAVWCAGAACGIGHKHFRDKKHPMLRSFYLFHFYYHVRRILRRLLYKLPGDSNFDKINNGYSSRTFNNTCEEYGVSKDPHKYKGEYIFASHQEEGKDIKRPGFSEYDNNSMMRWILKKTNGFTKVGLLKISESVRAYVYLVITSQTSVELSLVKSTPKNQIIEHAFKTKFEEMIGKNFSLEEQIKRYQHSIKEAPGKVDYSVGQGLFMMPSNMEVKSNAKKVKHNNEIIVSTL